MKLKNIIFTLTAASALMFFAVGCGKSPKEVTESFAKEMGNGNYKDGIEKYLGGPEKAKALPEFEQLPVEKKAEIKNRFASIEILEEKIDGDKATVTVKFPGRKFKETIMLEKFDGEWKITGM